VSSSVSVSLADYDYELPAERIAQQPAAEREAARLLVLDRSSESREHAHVADLPRLLRAGDLLVVNATRVVPARLRGAKQSGGRAEALILGPLAETGRWRALLRCRGRQRAGQVLRFGTGDDAFDARIEALRADGEVELAIDPGVSPYRAGETPLPPYIRRAAAAATDVERYQTVFAREPGAIAAPTAGLHFGAPLLDALAAAGIERAEIVLHVGAGTFRPLHDEDLARGRLHPEPFEIPEATADAIARTRARGGRVVAVGTTTTRERESCADDARGVRPGRGETDLFLRPGSPIRVVDALVTNFHLPRSSLLLLVAAFCERPDRDAAQARALLLGAYAEALRLDYRFYSYGDAMLIQ
jgi:S-adenosylmethionine:tRNA ribosyltransferase-isomerase